MKNRITIGIFFFLFALTASGVFAAFSQNPRQGSLALSVTSQPGSAENAAETHQGLTCIILNPVSVGAFTSKDPIGFNGGNNLYRYADNNPVLFIDPFGLAVGLCPKSLSLNVIHVSYKKYQRLPYDRSVIEFAFRFLNEPDSKSSFDILDTTTGFTTNSEIIGYVGLASAFNQITETVFSRFSKADTPHIRYVNLILSETNFPNDSDLIMYGLTRGGKSVVDWNNGVHLGNPSYRAVTMTHETGHAMGVTAESGGIMTQNSWSEREFLPEHRQIILDNLAK